MARFFVAGGASRSGREFGVSRDDARGLRGKACESARVPHTSGAKYPFRHDAFI